MRPTLRRRTVGLISTLLMAGACLAATTTGADAQPSSATSVKPLAGLFHPVKNVGDNLCLQPEAASTALFAKIVQKPCDGSIAQGWQYLQLATNHYRLENQLSGYCIWAWDGAFNGGRVLQDECHSSNSEINTAATLPDVVKLESRVGFRDTGFCIDVPGGAGTDGLAMQIYQCNGTLAQRWVVGF